MSESLTGRCACGAISYTIGTRIRQAVNCHCSMCRRHNGSAFSSYAVVPDKYFELSDPDGALSGYGFSERVKKHFCARCGTPLFNQNGRYPNYSMIYLGTLDEPERVTIKANIHCASALDWVSEVDAINSYPEDFEG